ncbi:MAG: hypothetical protein R3326_06385 [Gemmatimonadota bacterium]|nr:hypothetical protein [Gemmatimonadota bacterium]
MPKISLPLGVALVAGVLTACSDGSTPVAPMDPAPNPTAPPTGSAPAVGEVRLSTPSSGSGTVPLAFETGSEEYLLVIESTAGRDVAFDLALDAAVPATSTRTDLSASASPNDVEAAVLERGYELLQRHGPAAPSSRALAPAADRTFWVLDQQASAWAERPARLVHDGDHSLVYVDADVSVEDFPDAEARELGEAFDRSVYDRIREVYGAESDLDGNGRAIVLLTPIVNAQASAKGRVYGFFMPADLSDFRYSNRGEVFYLLVPDPTGRYGPATPSADRMRESLLGVAAHEFVHMISANQRLVKRRLPAQDYWLEEGLAHFGELVVDRLSAGNILGFLSEGSMDVSLVGSEVLTRGASTLFVTRLAERFGRGVIGDLVIGPGVGPATVESATGSPYPESFHDWALALHNEIYPVAEIPETFESLDLAGLYGRHVGSPWATNALGRLEAGPGGSSEETLRMRGGSVAYVVVRSDRGPTATDFRYRVPSSADLQIAVVRIR